MIRAVAVVGPTGAGKTRLAIALARALDSEILSADSMQFYRGMEIGTAAPTPEERALAPHHFVGILSPSEDMAAGAYQRMARERARTLLDQGKLPVLVGGSGLYVSAFIDGLFEGPARDQATRDRLREEAAQCGNTHMMDRLRAVDPDYARHLTSDNDLVRIVRALEVYELTGRPFSDWHREHQEQGEPWETLQVAPLWERDILYDRINRRVEAMVAQGWREETERLLEAGHGPDIERLKALGYREMAACIRGACALEDAVAATRQHHRRYAKRQMTWFRADKRIVWAPCATPDDLEAVALDILQRLRMLTVAHNT